MNNYQEFCICEECRFIFENPILLPCGSTICKEHVDESCEDTFYCESCDMDHIIPEMGFPTNKLAIKIKESRIHLNEKQIITIDSYEKLEKKIQEHQSLNSENLIYEYFSNLRNQVDLHREQMIGEINKRSEEIIRQLKELEEKCKLNAAKLVKMNLDQLKSKDMNKYKIRLRRPDLKDFDLSKLYSDIIDKIDDIQDDINNFTNLSLINQNIQFKKDNSNLFGELKVENIQEPIKTVQNRAEATLRFVIDDFSKFKESRQKLHSKVSCIRRGLEWRIRADSRKFDDGTFKLGIYLVCRDNMNESKKLPFWAYTNLKLLHLTNPDKNRIRSKKIRINIKI
jgi:hypothetical protein